MDHIQDYGRDKVQYLYAWAQTARQGAEGISYCGERTTGQEVFRIELNDLGKPLPRGLQDEHWREFFSWKQRRLGQQLINLVLNSPLGKI
jgi:hypothetical protein